MPFLGQKAFKEKHKEVIMPLFRITVKQSKNSSGIRIEEGMSVEVVSNSFNRIYRVDIKKAGTFSMAYLDVKRIG